MKSEELKGKRLAVFGANNVVDEVTAYARRHGMTRDALYFKSCTTH